MPTSRTIVAPAPGAPDSLVIERRPAAAPGAGEVAVEVTVTGVNPVDAKVIEGAFGPGLFPYTPGTEFVGRVTATGEGVAGVAVGDRVAALTLPFRGDPGTWADQVILPADRVAPVPDALTDEVAGTNVLLPLTAAMLARAAALPAGATAVVPGAAGGVGRWLVQFLVRDGVQVTAVVSDADRAAVEALGATAVSRTDADALAALSGFDVVFDVAGGAPEQLQERRGWLRPEGRYLSVTAGGDGIEMMMVSWDADALVDAFAGIAAGEFSVLDAALYAPERVASALGDYLSRAKSRTALDFRQGR